MATRVGVYQRVRAISVGMFTVTTSNEAKATARGEQSYHHGDLKNALIAAGLAILASDGVERLTLREVARRARVSHTAPYRHFANKEALLAAIAEDGFAQLTAALEAALMVHTTTARSATAQVVAGGLAYVQFAQHQPAIFRLMFSQIVGDRSQHPTLSLAAKRAFVTLQDAIIAGQQRDEFVVGPADQLTMALWAMVHGLAMLVIDNQIPLSSASDCASAPTQTLTALLHTMLTGLKEPHHD